MISRVLAGTWKIVADWSLRVNVTDDAFAVRISADWYDFRPRTEAFHDRIKVIGQQLKSSQQESKEAVAKRLQFVNGGLCLRLGTSKTNHTVGRRMPGVPGTPRRQKNETLAANHITGIDRGITTSDSNTGNTRRIYSAETASQRKRNSAVTHQSGVKVVSTPMLQDRDTPNFLRWHDGLYVFRVTSKIMETINDESEAECSR